MGATILPLEKCRIVKQVYITEYNSDIPIAYLLYERKFSHTYKFPEMPALTLDSLLSIEFPEQHYYPHDIIDDHILQAVKDTRSPNAFIVNYLITHDVDEKGIEELQKMPFEDSFLRITPATPTYFEKGFNNNFETIKDLKIYVIEKTDDFNSIAFLGKYNLNNRAILDHIKEVTFL